jgi:hypothetical protein
MYTKEQIIEEIKRVAANMGVKTLQRKEFEQNTMIPPTTVRYYLSSWNQALKEAGLEPGDSGVFKRGQLPEGDDELLKDLIRLFKEHGEIPTRALVTSKGKYDYRYYGARWKSLSEAFALAREKFPGPTPPTVTDPSPPKAEQNEDIEAEDIKADDIEVSVPEVEAVHKLIEEPEPVEDPGETIPSGLADFSELGITPPPGIGKSREEDEAGKIITDSPKTMTEPPVEEPIALNGTEMMPDEGDKMIDKQKIKLIPQTIKPKVSRKKTRALGESVHFRGLKFAPLNDKGVAYLFGMVSHELGFVIEALRAEVPDCEGKRCLDTTGNQWEHVKLSFEYKSSDFKKHGHSEDESDIIVCWLHDWDDCPLEVLELRSTVSLLDVSEQP